MKLKSLSPRSGQHDPRYVKYSSEAIKVRLVIHIIKHFLIALLAGFLATSVTFEMQSFAVSLFVWTVVFLVSFGYIGGCFMDERFMDFSKEGYL